MTALKNATNTLNTETNESVHEKETVISEQVVEAAPKEMETTADNVTKVDVQMESVQSEAVAVVEVPADEDGNEEEMEETKEKTEEELLVEYNEVMGQGRRLMKCSSYQEAIDVLSSACELAEKLFATKKEASFEPYFLYGQALFEVAKLEDDVIDNAMTSLPVKEKNEDRNANDSIDEEQYGDPEKLTETEREEIKKKVEDALADGPVDKETAEKQCGEDAKVSTEPSEDTKLEETTSVESSADAMDTEESSNGAAEKDDTDCNESEGDEEEDEEPTTMHLAWEILECARNICAEKLKVVHEEVQDLTGGKGIVDDDLVPEPVYRDKEAGLACEAKRRLWRLRRADVQILLGEILCCNGDYEKAKSEFKLARETRKEFFGQDSRMVAQCYHLEAKTYRLNNEFSDAAYLYECAKISLQNTFELLEGQAGDSSLNLTQEMISDKWAEARELRELCEELQELEDDCNASSEQERMLVQKLRDELAPVATMLALSGDKGGAEPANDITNMIRRPAKRPASTQPPAEEAKKAKEEGFSPSKAEEVAKSVTDKEAPITAAAEVPATEA